MEPSIVLGFGLIVLSAASNGLLALPSKFVRKYEYNFIAVLSTYYMAQICIIINAVRILQV